MTDNKATGGPEGAGRVPDAPRPVRAPGSRPRRRTVARIPRWLWIPAGLGFAFIVVPLLALVLRADWGHFVTLITSESSMDALWLSLRTALAATVVCLILGIPMALVFARTTFPGQRVVRAFVLVPLVLPPVVGGIALLYTFGRRGLIGQSLDLIGVQIPFTVLAVIMAQTFVALPFLVISVEGALRSAGTRFEGAAATLGAGPWTVLWRVTIPLILPGVVSGAILSFALALGEFGATLAFAGSLQGVTRTLPLQVYLVRESDSESAVALALVLIVLAVIGVVLAYRPGKVR